MILKIIFLFLLVNYTKSEFNTGLWRSQEREYDKNSELWNGEYENKSDSRNNTFERHHESTQGYGNIGGHLFSNNDRGMSNHNDNDGRDSGNFGSHLYSNNNNREVLKQVQEENNRRGVGNFGSHIYSNNSREVLKQEENDRRDIGNFGSHIYSNNNGKELKQVQEENDRRDAGNFGSIHFPNNDGKISKQDENDRRDTGNFGSHLYSNNNREISKQQENDRRDAGNFGSIHFPNNDREAPNQEENDKRDSGNFGSVNYSNNNREVPKQEENDGRDEGNLENLNSNTDREMPKEQENDGKDSDTKRSLIPEVKCGLDIPRRIIGGSTTDIDEFPWLGLLQYVDSSGNISHDCSGVLISKRYVLTAAHCTHGLGIKTRNMKLRKVRLGEWDVTKEKDCQGEVCSAELQDIEVDQIIPHEKYKASEKSQANDIALIRLRKQAKMTQFVQPICLPFDQIGNTDYEGKKLTVSGWGRTSNGRDSSSNIKLKVDLPVVKWDRCRQFYQSFYGNIKISKSQFCAGGEEGKDTCQGDSGGPLMTTERKKNEIKWYVIGIVSSGPAACGVQDRPSLYTNVSQYTDWILDNIKS